MQGHKLSTALLLLVVATLAMAEDKKPGEITDWCPPCKRLITDFSAELKTEGPQKIYERTCNDIYLEDPDFNKVCTHYYVQLYTFLREHLNAGASADQICQGLKACESARPNVVSERFVDLHKDRNVFPLFNRVF